MALTLTADERTELERRVRRRKIRAEDARGARVIPMLADGVSYSWIEVAVPCYRDTSLGGDDGFSSIRVDGLRVGHGGQPPAVLTPAVEARILEKTRQCRPTRVRIGVRRSSVDC
jgi:hypothetical protein